MRFDPLEIDWASFSAVLDTTPMLIVKYTTGAAVVFNLDPDADIAILITPAGIYRGQQLASPNEPGNLLTILDKPSRKSVILTD